MAVVKQLLYINSAVLPYDQINGSNLLQISPYFLSLPSYPAYRAPSTKLCTLAY